MKRTFKNKKIHCLLVLRQQERERSKGHCEEQTARIRIRIVMQFNSILA
jgi:hypothetical protein